MCTENQLDSVGAANLLGGSYPVMTYDYYANANRYLFFWGMLQRLCLQFRQQRNRACVAWAGGRQAMVWFARDGPPKPASRAWNQALTLGAATAGHSMVCARGPPEAGFKSLEHLGGDGRPWYGWRARRAPEARAGLGRLPRDATKGGRSPPPSTNR